MVQRSADTLPPGGKPTWLHLWICAGLLVKSRIVAVMLFRLKQWLRRRHVPLLPALCDRLAMFGWNVNLGNHTQIGPGLYLSHGNVVVEREIYWSTDTRTYFWDPAVTNYRPTAFFPYTHLMKAWNDK